MSFAVLRIQFVQAKGKNSAPILIINDERFYRNRARANKQYWKCSQYYKPHRCPAMAIVYTGTNSIQRQYDHNHGDWGTVEEVVSE